MLKFYTISILYIFNIINLLWMISNKIVKIKTINKIVTKLIK